MSHEELPQSVGLYGAAERFLSMAIKGTFMVASSISRRLRRYDDLEYSTEVYLEREKPLELDIWRLKESSGPLPIVLYIHGGAFKALSKETHWVMGLQFARAGYLTFVIDYRLAPQHPCPSGLLDVAEAYRWILKHAAEYGGDLNQIVVAGESAGANLTLALTLACYRPFEPLEWLYEEPIKPKVIAPACGIFAVTNTERFYTKHGRPKWELMVLQAMERDYQPQRHLLGNPLLLLEDGLELEAFPACWILSSTNDVVLSDSKRLYNCLSDRGVVVELDCAYKELHAFHALIWTKNAKLSWRRKLSFIGAQLG